MFTRILYRQVETMGIRGPSQPYLAFVHKQATMVTIEHARNPQLENNHRYGGQH